MGDLVFNEKMLEDIVAVLRENAERRTACQLEGHPGERVISTSYFRGVLSSHCFCSDCGAAYSRTPTKKEYDSFNSMLHNPVTI